MTAWVQASPDGASLAILVQPRASRTQVVGEHDGRLKIALAAPPVDGEANDALVRFLADRLELRRSDIQLVDGETSRRKRLLVRGVAPAQIVAMLSGP